jgi:hypothetical protein
VETSDLEKGLSHVHYPARMINRKENTLRVALLILRDKSSRDKDGGDH